MPFFLIILGGVLVVAGARNTQGDLLTLVEGDFTGPNNFVYWFLSIMVIGALGYIKPIKPFANAMIALVIAVLVLKSGQPGGAGGGLFAKLQSQIGALQTTKPTPVSDTYNAGVTLI